MSSTTKPAPAPKKLRPLYKVLDHEGKSPTARFEWPLPDPEGPPGEWVEVKGKLVQCRNGLHLTPDPLRVYQDGYRIFEAEYDPTGMLTPEGDYEVIVRKARLVRRIPWAELKTRWGITPEGTRDRPFHHGSRRPRAPEPATPSPKARREQSPAMKLLTFVGDEAQRKGLSTSKFRHALRAGLDTVIATRLAFHIDDFKAVYARWGYASLIDGYGGERFYAEAVKTGHETALKSFEAFTNRKPFVWEGKRLYVGANFPIGRERYEVTSFDDEKHAITVCNYTWKTGPHGYAKKLLAQQKISLTDLVQCETARKARVKRTSMVEKLTAELREHVEMPTMFNTGLWGKSHAEIHPQQVDAFTDVEIAAASEWASECSAVRRRRTGKDVLPPPPPCVQKAIDGAEREKARGVIQSAKREANHNRGSAWEYVVEDAEITAFLAGEDWKALLTPPRPKQKSYVPPDKRRARDPRIKALIPLLEGLADPAWRPSVESFVYDYFSALERIDDAKRERLRLKREAARGVSTAPTKAPA